MPGFWPIRPEENPGTRCSRRRTPLVLASLSSYASYASVHWVHCSVHTFPLKRLFLNDYTAGSATTNASLRGKPHLRYRHHEGRLQLTVRAFSCTGCPGFPNTAAIKAIKLHFMCVITGRSNTTFATLSSLYEAYCPSRKGVRQFCKFFQMLVGHFCSRCEKCANLP